MSTPTTARRSTSSGRSSATWRSGRITPARPAGAHRAVGRRGGAGPGHRRLHGSQRAPPSRQRRRRRRAARGRPSSGAVGRGPTGRPPSRRPSPTPEGELFIYNWAEYMGEERHPVVRGEVRRQGHLRLLRQLRHDARQDRPGRRRLRHHVPDLDRHPGPAPARASIQPLDLSLMPEHRQPRRGVGEPRLRPGQRALDPVHVVDDRRRLRHREGRRRS